MPFIFTTSMPSTICVCRCKIVSGRSVMVSRSTCDCVVRVFFPWRLGRLGPNMVTKSCIACLWTGYFSTILLSITLIKPLAVTPMVFCNFLLISASIIFRCVYADLLFSTVSIIGSAILVLLFVTVLEILSNVNENILESSSTVMRMFHATSWRLQK